MSASRILSTLAASAVLTAAASAADLPVRAPPPVVAVPLFTFSGYYAGFNAGYAFSTRNSTAPTVVGVPATTNLFATAVSVPGVLAYPGFRSQDGFTGGGQIGYNYQFRPGSGLVIGAEADAQYVDFPIRRGFAASSVGTLRPGTLVFNPNGISGLDYFGTVRGRLGYAFDRTMIYATGGFAYTSYPGRVLGTSTTSDNFLTGYAVGGGVAYALPTDTFLNPFKSSAVVFKVEGMYVNLGAGSGDRAIAQNAAGAVITTNTAGVSVLSGPIGRRNEIEFAVVRAGISYKFWGN